MMSNGALFYKADLHIHSYGPGNGSFDVTDVSNTPQAIVDTAIVFRSVEQPKTIRNIQA